jgi:CRISPR-associated protein Csb2
VFGFRIVYLTGTVVAADFATGNDKSAVEWPPHPDRLFSALVQAWGDLGEPQDGKAALQWLERLPSPALRFRGLPEESQRTNVMRYVPANDDIRVMGRLRNPRRLPSAWVGDDPVDLYWPDSDPREHWMALERLASAVASLGHSSSLVTVRLMREGNGEAALGSTDGKWLELVPDPGGPIGLRVPYPERLEHLIQLFRAQPRQRPASGAWATYSVAKPGVQATSGMFGDMLIFRLRGTGRLPLVSTSQVIRALRSSILAHADQPVPEVISGHAPGSTSEHPQPSQRPHLALVSLPDVGHTHAGGHLSGVAAVLPRGLDSQQRRSCLRAVGAGTEKPLVVGRLGVWKLERQSLEINLRGLLPTAWTSAAGEWSTVTPFVFGRYPADPYGTEAVQIVRESCRMAGLPQPVKVEIGPVSAVLGVPRASEFPALASRLGKPRKYHVHLRLLFSEPISGPVLLGWGRYQGYGLCHSMQEYARE